MVARDASTVATRRTGNGIANEEEGEWLSRVGFPVQTTIG